MTPAVAWLTFPSADTIGNVSAATTMAWPPLEVMIPGELTTTIPGAALSRERNADKCEADKTHALVPSSLVPAGDPRSRLAGGVWSRRSMSEKIRIWGFDGR